MKNHNSKQEWVSALADGEVAIDEVDAALKKLRNADERATWDVYHQIGDVLRTDDMDMPLSKDFAARMAARLEAEPTIVSPAVVTESELSAPKHLKKAPTWYAKPAMAVAFVAFAAVSAPQWINYLKSSSPAYEAQTAASTSKKDINTVSVLSTASQAVPARDHRKQVQLQDRHIDEYLFAHQRSSPSVYNTDQLVHQVSLASDAKK